VRRPGALLCVESFEATTEGYKKLLAWRSAFGPVEPIGVQGTGSYGAGLSINVRGNPWAMWSVLCEQVI